MRTTPKTTMMGAALALGLFAAPAMAQEVGSASEAICCGADCCRIDSVCYTNGEASSDDSCLVCDPSSSQSSFTNTCGTPDAGSTTPPPDTSDDDGCSAAGGAGSAYGLLLAGLALIGLRRRR